MLLLIGLTVVNISIAIFCGYFWWNMHKLSNNYKETAERIENTLDQIKVYSDALGNDNVL